MNAYCIPGLKREIKPIISIERIEETVCQYFDIYSYDLRTNKRKSPLPLCRHLVYWFSRNLIKPMPYLIAIGGRYDQHHTTVLNGITMINDRIKYEVGFREVIIELENKIKAI